MAVFLSVGACVADKDAAGPVGKRSGEVRLGAYLEDFSETRAQNAKYIDAGTYYMTYPNFSDNTTHSVCQVNFHDGIGVTTTQNNKELKWEEVGSLTYNDNLTNFFLDNIAPPDGVDPNATEIFFTDIYHPFDAAEYAGDLGYNDLLWGYAFVDLYTTSEINIGIHHYLSRVSVIVTVDNTLENAQEIDFENGSVRITNLVTKPKSYIRTSGSVTLGEDPEYEDLELAENGGWDNVSTDSDNPKIFYYQTKNFVLPPQALRTDELRPRLVLDVPQPDGSIRKYSGVIPRVMMVDGSPATMAFDPEKNLTLKVKISQDKLRIESIVAYVQDWVDKGTYLVTADQGAIFSSDDLLNLTKIYKDQDYDGLKKYGFRHVSPEGVVTWSFNIFSEPEIKIDEVKNTMAEPLPDFWFDITSHFFTLVYSDGTKKKFGNGDTYDTETTEKIEKILHDLLRFGIIPPKEEDSNENL